MSGAKTDPDNEQTACDLFNDDSLGWHGQNREAEESKEAKN